MEIEIDRFKIALALELTIFDGIGESNNETTSYRFAGSGIHKNIDVYCD